MKNWQEDQLARLEHCASESEVFDELAATAGKLGFDFCAFGMRMPLPISAPKTIMFGNYPQAWHKKYQECGYMAIDPTVKHGLQSVLPLVWTEEVFGEAREFWEEAKSFGLHHGWAQSCRDARGISSMLTLARSHESLAPNELEDKGLRMLWLTQIAHASMARLLGSRMMPEWKIELTNREITVLRWTAEGKTSGEISNILNITERTVNFHINNIVAKLGTSNKTAAAIRAALIGII